MFTRKKDGKDNTSKESRVTKEKDKPEETDNEKKDGEKKAEADPKASMKDFLRVYSHAKRLDVLLFTLGTIASIGAGITLPLMNIVFGKLANNFNSYFVPGSGTNSDEFNDTLNRNTLFIVYLFIAKFVLKYVALLGFRIGGLRISASLRLAYLKAVFAQPLTVLDQQPPGFAATTITTSCNTIQAGISDRLAQGVEAIAQIVAALVVAFTYSWSLTLVSFCVPIIILIIYSIIIPLIVNQDKSINNANDKASAIASESFGAIRMIAACCAEQKMIKRYNEWVYTAEERGMKMALIAIAQWAPAFITANASFALVFWVGAKFYTQGKIENVSVVIIAVFSILMIVGALSAVAQPIMAASKAASAASSFFDILDRPRIDGSGLKEPDVSPHKDIILKDVVFAYPSRGQVKILDSLSVNFEAGKLTAIVGPSGSGKSTIVGLLERWYEIKEGAELIGIRKDSESKNSDAASPEKKIEDDDTQKDIVPISGSISIDGHELHELDLKWWRSQIGLVQQEPFLFNDTIFANVAYGLIGSQWEKESEQVQRELVAEACKEAFADEFIDLLPQKYDTKVGDGGIKLSGGQRQRIAIARSVIKRPSILILDEATSAIDVRAEKIVQEALDRVSKNRTTITIAHRLSTIRKADKIVVLRNGVLVESGSHNALLEDEDGIYAGLVRAQQLTMEQDEGSEEIIVTDKSALVEEELKELHVAESARQPGNQNASNIEAQGDDRETSHEVPLHTSFMVLLYEQRMYWGLYIFALAATMICAASTPLQSFLTAHVITTFQQTGSVLLSQSSHWSLMFLCLAIAVAVGYGMMGYTTTAIGAHVTRAYKTECFFNIVNKPIGFFDAEENSTGSLTSRTSNDPQQLQQLLSSPLGLALISIFSLLGTVIISLVYGWKLALVGICVALPLILGGIFYRVRLELSFDKLNAEVFATSSQFASECLAATRTVMSLTLEDMICDRYELLLRTHVEKAFVKARLRLVIVAISESLSLLCMALTFWYGGRLMSSMEYNPLQFFVIYSAVIAGGEQIGVLGGLGPNLAQTSAAANRILGLRPSEDPSTSAQLKQAPVAEAGAKIVLEDIHFRYPTRSGPIFAGLSLTIEKGQFAALVGASGCGKTSIISLVERFYDVQKGRITYNGEDVKDLDLLSYRENLSLVAQEPNLFQGTIRENITLGVDDDTVAEEDIHRACKDAEIHDFILSLPEGYSTPLGSAGLSLSGGQKQRLSIARALLRNPTVLLLDEATSSLDSASEALVQAAFERASRGRTMIVVAHRLATVQNADVIFVLGSGGPGQGARVLERGDHRTLLRKRGVYFQMCQSQALDR